MARPQIERPREGAADVIKPIQEAQSRLAEQEIMVVDRLGGALTAPAHELPVEDLRNGGGGGGHRSRLPAADRDRHPARHPTQSSRLRSIQAVFS